MNSFPLIKRFSDIKKTSSLILSEESIIYEKCFRKGTIFLVVGWREILGKNYYILSKGSWEGLVSVEKYSNKLEKLENDK